MYNLMELIKLYSELVILRLKNYFVFLSEWNIANYEKNLSMNNLNIFTVFYWFVKIHATFSYVTFIYYLFYLWYLLTIFHLIFFVFLISSFSTFLIFFFFFSFFIFFYLLSWSNFLTLGVKFNKFKESSTKAEPFLFLTIYDPRSSTEYQCGAKKESKLYNALHGIPMGQNSLQQNSNKNNTVSATFNSSHYI